MHFKQNHFNQAKTTEPKFNNSWSICPHRRNRRWHRRVLQWTSKQHGQKPYKGKHQHSRNP